VVEYFLRIFSCRHRPININITVNYNNVSEIALLQAKKVVEELASRLIDDLGLEGTLAFSTNGVRSNTVEVVEPGATIKLVSQEVEKINDLVG